MSKFLSTRKIAIIPYIPRITAIILKSSYFYIVSRQEETRFQLVSKPFKTINPQKYHANDTQNTRLQLKILRIKLNKIRKLKGVKMPYIYLIIAISTEVIG